MVPTIFYIRKVKSLMKSFFKFIIYSLLLSIIVNILYIKFISKSHMNLFGFSCLKVITGSMSPTIEAGENIIIKKCRNYNVGDIITYITEENYLVTHRIVSKDGDRYYTKGDFNNVQDLEPISINQICGKVIYHFKSLFPISFAQYQTSNSIKGMMKIAKPIFIVNGDNQIFIEKYGSLNDYSFSVRNYNLYKRKSDVSFNYKIHIEADDKIQYQLFYNDQEVDINKTFELSNQTYEEHTYTLKIQAPEDYEGTVKLNVYAFQKEV